MRDGARVDWSGGIIRSVAYVSAKTTASGLPVEPGEPISAGRTRSALLARERATAGLLGALGGIELYGRVSLRDYMAENEEAQYGIAALVDERVKLKTSPVDFFTVRTEAVMSISDIVRALPMEFPAEEIPAPADAALPTKYTALIVDARGLPVRPMIFPAVYDEDGLEIYSRYKVDPERAAKDAMVSYCTTEKAAFTHRKSGAHPYFAAALRELKGNPVIAHADVRKVLSHPENRINLKKCRVIFIVDAVR